MPLDEHIFWIIGTAASVLAVMTPAFLVLNRLGNIETRIAILQTDINWITFTMGMRDTKHETTARP